MTDIREATSSLLEEHPAVEPALRELLALDEDGPWTFHETDLDSGTFGEIVSADIVEKRDGAYQFVDRTAVRAVVDGDWEETESRATGGFGESDFFDRVRTTVDWNAALLFVGGLLLVVLLRLLPFQSVFYSGDVVLLGNDPYYYRYWVEQLTATAGTSDLSGISALPESVKKGEPLLVTTLWLVSSLFGGSRAVVGIVVASYPIVAAVIVGVFVYLTAKSVSNDRRVGLAAVLMLAFVPVHAYRSGLGFADHHAFDYVWLALTALALVELVAASDRSWLYSGLFSVGIIGQILAWDNGPLLVVPVAFVSTFYAAILVAEDRSPLRDGVPLVASLGVASALVWAAHTTLGWHTTVVASVPTLLTVGTVVVLGLGEVARRGGVSSRQLLGIEAIGGTALLAGLLTLFPALSQGLTRGTDALFGAQNIVETTSLVSGEMGSIFGPLLLLGLVFVLGFPYVLWATVRAVRHHDAQLVTLSVYAWWFFVLALVQLRFSGEFSVFLAVFAGIGFVHVASVVGLTDSVALFSDKPRQQPHGSQESKDDDRPSELSIPSRRDVLTYLGFTAFVGSLSFVQIPVKFSQLTFDRDQHQTAVWMREYADEKEWSYPQSYVFSQWGVNRMYNFFVNGEADSYEFARQNFAPFLNTDAPEQWYNQLKDRVGFVLVDVEEVPPTLGAQLSNYGTRTEENSALSHYRAVYKRGQYCVFTLVSGKTLTGTADEETVTATTEVEIAGAAFTYENSVDVGADGTFSVTVPYPGEYQVAGETYAVDEGSVTAADG